MSRWKWPRWLRRKPKLTKAEQLLTEYVNCPHEFDDERMKYVAVQVDKGLLKEAKSLLGI